MSDSYCEHDPNDFTCKNAPARVLCFMDGSRFAFCEGHLDDIDEVLRYKSGESGRWWVSKVATDEEINEHKY